MQAHRLGRRAGEPRGERVAIALERALDVHRLPEPPEPAELAGRQVLARRQRLAEPAEQRHQRQDVVPVVGEHPAQRRRPPRAKEVEVERRDQAAGDVVLARDTDDLALERRQPAVGQIRRPHAPRRPQQVEVRQGRPATARQDKARLEQRQVEARPVEGHEAARSLQERPQRRQQRGLLVEIAHEVLREHEAVVLEPGGSDQERVGSRAAGEPGRLGVEEEEPPRVLDGALGRARPRSGDRGGASSTAPSV